ncbi:MAG: insulinase family protein [Tannerella sp.]|jgi:predicted Zn-dependent peptidase|nr:insulinase family protein [Tannerella sp.]
MSTLSHTLANGLRIVHLPADSSVAYCGFAVNAGARDENPKESGLAHFVEHTLFKGTVKRKAWHILNRMENVGGDLNAYTSKEETFIYSVFMEKDFERAVELMSDLIINSQFPENELDKEREIIIDEILSYEDSPSELIFDDFENLLFDGHPLGHHILGDERSLATFGSASGLSFLKRFYTAGNMVFFSMSKTDFKTIRKMAEKYLAAIPSQKAAIGRSKPHDITPQRTEKKKTTHLSHIITGGRAYDMHDEKRYPLFLLNNILGGPGMNSRLNVSLREKHGLVYSVESNVTSYTDTGVFSVYFGTDPKNREKAISLVEKEFAALRDKKLSGLQLTAAKKQATGQLGVASDQKENRFLGLGKSFLHYNHYETLPDVFRKIENITAEQVLEAANEILHPEKMFRLIYE